MNPVNATALYVSACRSLLQFDAQDPEKYVGLFNVLTFFRDSLSCLACGNLLQDPIAPQNSSCQHYVCKGCKGKKMLLKPSCSWCTDCEQFEENKQLKILIDCYRSLCEYVSVCVTTEPSALGVKGYSEVKMMLEEVLGVKEEQEQISIHDVHSPETLHLKAVKDTSRNTADMNLTGSDQFADKPLTQTKLQTPKPPTATASEPLSSTELNTDAVTVPNSDVCQVSGAKPSVRNTSDLENPESDIASKDRTHAKVHKPAVSCGLTKTAADPCQQSPRSQTSSHPQQPQTGMCLAASHRKVRLSRKRSRSESDSEMLQPLPIANLIQGPSVAAAASPKVACEPKAPSSPAVVLANGGIVKVNRLDLTKNIHVNTDLVNKKIQSKSKVAAPKSKSKVKDRVLPASMLPGPTKVVYKKTQEKKGCKCGRATQNPSVLTCRGQRCPCYSNRKACLDCICRGCQNSYMANGEKKLEAFAVPEKALEQTRLTLGINLTSISVRNAGSNAGVLSLSAGSPMASFLTSSADEDQNFEDALEMHFDC